MGLRDWLFGRGKNKSAEAISVLKAQINRKELESENYARQAQEQEKVAKRMVMQRNRQGAKQALIRSRTYFNRYNQSQNQVINLQSAVDTIMNASSSVQTVEAMDVAVSAIEESLGKVSEADTEEVLIRLEAQQERIAIMNESLGDITSVEMEAIDLDDDLSIDDQLDLWETDQGNLVVDDTENVENLRTEEVITPELEEKEDTADIENELRALRKKVSET